MLRLVDRLGRGRGRMRVLDSVLAKSPACLLRPDLTHWHNSQLSAIWIGHATVLLRVGSKTILTDPVLGGRVGVSLGLATAGPARLIAPALRISELPKLDLILISHAHFDHLDRPTLARLPKNVPVVAAANTRDLLDDLGFESVTELHWGQIARFDDLRVRAWEVRHWGARAFHDSHRHSCAFVLESGSRRVVFGGDTAYGRHFSGVGKVDLAVLGIGAYNPWETNHATPEQAWHMADHMHAEFMLPMHHSTFRLSHEPLAEPMERLGEIAGRRADRIVACRIGENWSLN